MKVIESKNLITDSYFKFPKSIKELAIGEKEILKTIGGLAYYFDDSSSFELKSYLEKTIFNLLDSNKIYFILIDKFPQPKNRIRSKYKLISQHKKNINKQNYYEIEYDLENNKSILTSIVRLTKNNLPYIINNFLNSKLSFGYIVPKRKSGFRTREKFLNEIISKCSNVNKMLNINLIKVSLKISGQKKFIFRTILDGKNNHSFEIYGKNRDLANLKSSLPTPTFEFSEN